MNIARIILQQLGGGRFLAMTGARNLFSVEGKALQFRLPSNFAKDGINFVQITLEPSDTYDMQFRRVRGNSVKDVAQVDGVHAEDLCAVFTEKTGLDCHL